jgi:hypothetical protein
VPIVKDIDEAYTLSLERGPTWRIWVPLSARKLTFFASSRYVLYLESTIPFVNIDLSLKRNAPHQQIRDTLTPMRAAPRRVGMGKLNGMRPDRLGH